MCTCTDRLLANNERENTNLIFITIKNINYDFIFISNKKK